MPENTSLSKTNYNMIDDAITEYISQLNKNKSSTNEKSKQSFIKNIISKITESIKLKRSETKNNTAIAVVYILICILYTLFLRFFNINLLKNILPLMHNFVFIILTLVIWLLVKFEFELDRNNEVKSPNLLIILEKHKIDSSNNYVLDNIKNYIIKYYINSSIFYYVNSILDSINKNMINTFLTLTILSNIFDLLKLMTSTRNPNLQYYISKILASIVFTFVVIYLILICVSLFDTSYKYKKIIRELDKIEMKNICVQKDSGDVKR